MKFSAGITLKNKENAFEDRICPLCTKFYAKSTPFDEFNDHVLSHFVEDGEQDSHMSLFEITAWYQTIRWKPKNKKKKKKLTAIIS